jgi:hypothetical protein
MLKVLGSPALVSGSLSPLTAYGKARDYRLGSELK